MLCSRERYLSMALRRPKIQFLPTNISQKWLNNGFNIYDIVGIGQKQLILYTVNPDRMPLNTLHAYKQSWNILQLQTPL